ncbi:MAG: polymer-forming cytoskeletal protein [Ruminococcus sp.]|jgi:cytoskeletal protein CcmA (bactofilin family)|nr:polymer-forming cytoskeletal protein [Ruminococcus sp.]
MSLKDNFNQAIKEILRKDGAVTTPPPSPELEKFVREQEAAAAPVSEPVIPKSTPVPEIDDTAGITPGNVPRVTDADALLRSVKTGEQGDGGQSNAGLSGGAGYTGGASGAEAVYPRGGAVDSLLGSGRRAYEEPDYNSAGRTPGANNPYAGAGVEPPYNRPGRDRSAGYGAYSGINTPIPDRFEAEETTIISRNTVIDGNIRAFANVSIEGSVKGDVKITKDITMSGRVVGNIECNNSNLMGASMQGNVVSKGQVQLDRDSLLLGDISAGYVNINGKIKGNVDIGGKAEFKSESYILGNISAATITVIDGANIQGYVNTTAFRDTTQNVFPESVAIEQE